MKLVFFILTAVIIWAPVRLVAKAQSTSTLLNASTTSELKEIAKEAATSIDGVVMSLSARAIVWLEAKQRLLERDIADLNNRDSQFVETPSSVEGLNEAAGGTIVTPVVRGPSVDTTFERLWKNVLLLLIKLAIYILKHPWLLYIVLGYIVLKIIFSFFRRRRYRD